LGIARVAVGARRQVQQAGAIAAHPGQQCRVFGQQCLQPFDVVVVNDAISLRGRRFETLAEVFTHFGR
jgi:hypothetical protein